MRAMLLIAMVVSFAPAQTEMPAEKAFAARLSRNEPLDARIALADDIARTRSLMSSPEHIARYTVLWLRAAKRVLEAAPESYHVASKLPWFVQHENAISFSEPGARWLLNFSYVYKLHDQYRQTSVADEIAWIAASAELPGECEGYIPCYAAAVDMLYGEYLRRHPAGAHLDDALARITERLEATQKLVDGPNADRFFDPKRDCKELLSQLAPLEAALQQVNAAGVVFAVEGAHLLAARCEP